MSTYAQILLFSFIIPLIFSFHPKIKFYLKWKNFFISNLLVAIPFIIWDIIFTKNKVWDFSDNHISDVTIYNLPIEEVLFFIIIPYCFIFTYHVIKKFTKDFNVNKQSIYIGTLFFSIAILIIGIYNIEFMYTSTTLIALGIVLIIISVSKQKFLLTFYLTFILITCIPFIIVNGLLTGLCESSINTATVTYNDNERAFSRFLSIPIEDFFYSMLLLITNTWMYELINRQSSNKETNPS